jgi:cytochrome c oxidase cbb3-type subunit 4
MTIGIVRGVLTLILFTAFIALWVWAWSKGRHADFAAAAQLPLEDEMPMLKRDKQT